MNEKIEKALNLFVIGIWLVVSLVPPILFGRELILKTPGFSDAIQNKRWKGAERIFRIKTRKGWYEISPYKKAGTNSLLFLRRNLNKTLTSLKPQVVGREGWYFLNMNGLVDDFNERKLFSPAQLEIWRERLGEKKGFLDEKKIPYLFVIPPNKQTIYPEYYSRWGRPAELGSLGRQLENYLKRTINLDVIFLMDAILEGKKGGALLYHKRDSHWNSAGKRIFIESVISHFNKEGQYRFPLWEDLQFPDKINRGFDLEAGLGGFKPPEFEQKTANSQACAEWVPFPEEFPAGVVDRLNKLKTLRFKSKAQNGTLLIFGDSFSFNFPRNFPERLRGKEFYPPIACFFEETYIIKGFFPWVNLPFLRFGVEAVQPDFVLEEHVERALKYGPSKEDAEFFSSRAAEDNPLISR